jgi:hypothetical protein
VKFILNEKKLRKKLDEILDDNFGHWEGKLLFKHINNEKAIIQIISLFKEEEKE